MSFAPSSRASRPLRQRARIAAIPLALVASASALAAGCSAPEGGGESTGESASALVNCGATRHRVCDPPPDPWELPPGTKPQLAHCYCVANPTASMSLARVIGVQPGWVRATFNVTEGGDTTDVEQNATVSCEAGTSLQSVKVTSHLISPTLLAVDVRADLDWLASQGLPRPCKVTEIDASYTWNGTPLASASAPYPFQMDLPLSHLRPGQLTSAISDTAIPLQPAASSRRHFAYPPQIVAIQSTDGRTAFAEVEELPSRGTVGLRALAAFWGSWLDRELGGGAEIYPGWGIDVDLLGVTKATSGVEESHPGFVRYPYSGSFVPALASGDKTLQIYPAPPLYSEATYLANVLDNKGVPRCGRTGGCLDVVYDASSHMLRAINGATVKLLDDGPIQPGVFPAMGAPILTAAPVTAGSGPLAPRALGASFAPSAPVSTPLARLGATASPQEAAVAARIATSPKPLGPIAVAGSCPLNGTFDASTVPLTHCGGYSSNSRCPTAADPVRVDALPAAPGNGYQVSLSRQMPYYAGRENRQGTCGSHAATQMYELLVNKLADDMLPPRAIAVDGESVVVPNPRIAYSVTGGLVDLYTWAGTHSGDPDSETVTWPQSGGMMPQFLEAYWPAREPDWQGWTYTPTSDSRARTALSECTTSGFWSSGYCVGQGQPPPGAYWDYSTQLASMGQDPLAGGPWSLSKTYFDLQYTSIPLDDRNLAIQYVMASLNVGLPVNMSFSAFSHGIGDGAGGSVSLLNDMSWYLPPELAGCDADSLNKAFQPNGGHAVNIVGYDLVGSFSSPDLTHSFFIIENNWGKGSGSGGFYTMNFSAFKYLAGGLTKEQLVCNYSGSNACRTLIR